jgi:CHAD domain-containing protein
MSSGNVASDRASTRLFFMAVETPPRVIRRSKWILDTSPDQPVEDVARRALEARLNVFWHYLPIAAAGPLEEIELVHQLRVSTRRAMAALDIFRDLLPPRRTGWLTKQLKKVRRAAGTARDLDVLIRRLTMLQGEPTDGPQLELLQATRQLREQAQLPVREIHEKLVRKDFPHRESLLLKRVRLRSAADRMKKPSFGQVARKELRPLVENFFAAAAGDMLDYEALHAFRIEGKRLRYASEVFAGAFDPSFRKTLYPLVESLQ